MKHKKLILTILMTLCMTIVAGFGVYATIASSLAISGTLNFVALTKEVYVNEIKLSNYVDANYVCQSITIDGYNGKYLKENASVSLGSGINVVQGETLEIAITMTNLTSSYLRANLSYSNLGTVSITTTGLIMPINAGNNVESGQAKTMKIYVTNTSTGTVNLSNLSLTVSFTDLGTSLLQDSGSYYYVEMGTLPNTAKTGAEYIKWRYIASNTTSSYTYDSSTVPSGLGYFLLLTDTTKITRSDGKSLSYCAFNNDYETTNYCHLLNGWTNIDANDYSTSSARAYINGENVYKSCVTADGITSPDTALHYSNMYDDFCIDKENDIVFQNIIGRTLADLYKGNNKDGTDVNYPTFNEGAKVISSSTVDKFWSMSYNEALYMLCNGTWSTSTNWSSSYSDRYFLRTPLTNGGNYYVSVISHAGGSASGNSVSNFNYSVRPAFKLNIK